MDPILTPRLSGAIGRLEHGDDLLDGLLRAAVDAEVDSAAIQAIGALERAVLGWYNPVDRRYEERVVPGPLEIVSCLGNVSERDGVPFVHVHVAVAGRDFALLGGHAMPGCRVFALEYTLARFPFRLPRRPDPATGLMLW